MLNIHTCTIEKLREVIDRARYRHARLVADGNYAGAAGVSTFLGIVVNVYFMRMIGGAR